MSEFDKWNKYNLGYTEKQAFEAGQQSQQAKIDGLQARVDKALTYLRHTDFRECKESILFNILKGNKDEK